jgi:hypothetical protein
MISIINESKANRNKLSWQIVKNAISRAESITSLKPKEYELLTSSESRSYFSRIPQNSKEWTGLVNRLKNLLFTNSLKARDFHIISSFIMKYENGWDVSDFFQKRTSQTEVRVFNYAKTAFAFNDNKNKDEELY